MDKLKGNPKLLAVLGAVVVVLIGGFLFLNSRNSPASPNPTPGSQTQLEEITAEEIGLEVTVRDDGRAVKFEITKADDIERIDYEIRYKKELEGGIVDEGIIGEMNIADDGITETDYRVFGTCSGSTCRYDENVSSVKIILRVEKTDGKVYSLEEPVDLN